MTNLLAAGYGALAQDAGGDPDGDPVQVLWSVGGSREDLRFLARVGSKMPRDQVKDPIHNACIIGRRDLQLALDVKGCDGRIQEHGGFQQGLAIVGTPRDPAPPTCSSALAAPRTAM